MKTAEFLLVCLLIISGGLNAFLYLKDYFAPPIGESLLVWNVPADVTPHSYLFATMFDTFRMSINLRANGTLDVYVFTPTQYAAFEQNGGRPSAYVGYYSGSQISFEWNLSTGCAGYVYVIYDPGSTVLQIVPHVTATYSPSSVSTGICSQS